MKRKEVIDLTNEDEERGLLNYSRENVTKCEQLSTNKKAKLMVSLLRCKSCTFLNDIGSSTCSICSSNLEDSRPSTPVDDCLRSPKFPCKEEESTCMLKCPMCTALNKQSSSCCDVCGEALCKTDVVNNTHWKACPECTFLIPVDSQTCSCCYTSFMAEGKSENQPTGNIVEVQIHWVCASCTLKNHIRAKSCSACDAPRLGIQPATKTGHDAESRNETKTSTDHGAVPAFMKVKESQSLKTDGLVQLLEKCYQTQATTGRSHYKSLSWRLCSPATHYTQRNASGAKWSCGYRNIQMLCDALMQRPEYRKVLFDGQTNGKVPGIYALQGWLERAWRLGFDTAGAEIFDWKVTGGNRWIGATECVALLRSFGVRAHVVDFDQSFAKMLAKSGIRSPQARQRSILEYVNAKDKKSLEEKSMELKNLKPEIHRLVTEWVWKYFSPDNHPSKDTSRIASGLTVPKDEQWPENYLPPLYFQHQGHSRTIIGMEKGVKRKNLKSAENLLVYDPAQIGSSIHETLASQQGWERFIKRGLHTLKKAAYQIVYIQPGLMTDSEKESSKKLKGEGPFSLINAESDFVTN